MLFIVFIFYVLTLCSVAFYTPFELRKNEAKRNVQFKWRVKRPLELIVMYYFEPSQMLHFLL